MKERKRTKVPQTPMLHPKNPKHKLRMIQQNKNWIQFSRESLESTIKNHNRYTFSGKP